MTYSDFIDSFHLVCVESANCGDDADSVEKYFRGGLELKDRKQFLNWAYELSKKRLIKTESEILYDIIRELEADIEFQEEQGY